MRWQSYEVKLMIIVIDYCYHEVDLMIIVIDYYYQRGVEKG